MGCELLHSDGKQASTQHRQGRQEERQAALPLHSCSGSLISRYCCSVGFFFFFASFVKQQQSPAIMVNHLSLSSSFSLLPSALFSESPDCCLSAWWATCRGPQVRWRGAPQLFPSDLYHVIVLILIVIGAESYLSNLMRVKWRHLGPEEAASWVACMWGHVAWVDRHAP